MEARLAAILIADVAGYTRLMEAYEFDTHRRLMALRADVVDRALAKRGGRIVKQTGDGFIAVFAGINDAACCAIEIQQAVQVKEASISPEQRLRFRMGLSVGDVVEQGGDLYGSGVNIAARLQELAEPGGLLITGLVHDQVGQNITAPMIDLGLVVLKNIQAPIRAFRILVAPEQAQPRRGGTWLRRESSIAVLPFRTLHADQRKAWFGEGIVEDIIGALSGLNEFFVISRNSTMAYREPDADVRRIGNDLGVRYVLSGSVRRTSQAMRICAELAETRDGSVLWAQTFDARPRDLFKIQDDITAEIVGKIAPRILEAEIQRAFRKRPDSMDAYDHSLQALALLHRLTKDDFMAAGVQMRRAIALDDSYSAPFALASEWHGLRVGQGWSPDPRADSREALRLAAAAVDRDPSNVRALTLLGHYKSFLLRDFDAALGLFDQAIAAGPSNAWAWGRSAPTYSYIGNGTEAIKRVQHALRLSPYDHLSYYYHTSLCVAHYTCGDYEQAIHWGECALRANPSYLAAAYPTVASLAVTGRKDAAGRLAAHILRINPTFQASVHADSYPYREKARRMQLRAHLVAAGLPR